MPGTREALPQSLPSTARVLSLEFPSCFFLSAFSPTREKPLTWLMREGWKRKKQAYCGLLCSRQLSHVRTSAPGTLCLSLPSLPSSLSQGSERWPPPLSSAPSLAPALWLLSLPSLFLLIYLQKLLSLEFQAPNLSPQLLILAILQLLPTCLFFLLEIPFSLSLWVFLVFFLHTLKVGVCPGLCSSHWLCWLGSHFLSWCVSPASAASRSIVDINCNLLPASVALA